MSQEPQLTDEERRELRHWLNERRDLKAQGRLLLGLGLAVGGFIGWLGIDHALAALKAAWNKF